MDIGKVIKERRALLGISQQDLSDFAGFEHMKSPKLKERKVKLEETVDVITHIPAEDRIKKVDVEDKIRQIDPDDF